MIISRRRYQEEVAKAVAEARQMDLLENRIGDVQCNVYREIGRLEELIRKIEARVMSGKEEQHERSNQPTIAAR